MTHSEIELKAYQRYCWRQQNGIEGNAEEDWLEAETELWIEEESNQK